MNPAVPPTTDPAQPSQLHLALSVARAMRTYPCFSDNLTELDQMYLVLHDEVLAQAATIKAAQEALTGHSPCDQRPPESGGMCAWQRAAVDARTALDR